MALNAKYNFVVSYEMYVWVWYPTHILNNILSVEHILTAPQIIENYYLDKNYAMIMNQLIWVDLYQ